MLEFEKQHRYIVWHSDAAAASSVVPFNVHACKFITGHVDLHTMEFLEDTKEVVEMFKAHVFNTKVIYNKAELDRYPFVVSKTGC
jgi:hypothetical protein